MANILLENCKNYQERQEVLCMEAVDKSKIDNVMVSKLYKSIIEKGHVDFEDIPNSKGDVTKYSGYNTMMETIELLKKLATASGITINEIGVVETSISNLRAHTKMYVDGFSLGIELIKLQYNSLVMACVQSVTCIIASYVDYSKRIDTVEFTMLKSNKRSMCYAVDILNSYNVSIKKGEYQKFLNALLQHKNGFVGADEMVIGVMIVGIAVSIVPLLRELIFYYYYTRMKASEYLDMQVMMLELNKKTIESSVANPKERREILKKQEKTMNNMIKISDKLKVKHALAEKQTVADTKKEQSNWSLANLKSEVTKIDSDFKLL